MLGSTIRAVLALLLAATSTAAAQQYDPGASATEIRLGQTMPYSGPVSVAGAVGQASLAYFAAVNKSGGINGRQIKLLSLDDGYSPPKTVEATRRLVEDDNVLLIYGSVGTPTNAAVEKYLNLKKVPQLFVTTGASRFRDPKASRGPWRSCPATSRKGGQWHATSSRLWPRPGLPCSTRMTTWARTSCPDSSPASATRRPP